MTTKRLNPLRSWRIRHGIQWGTTYPTLGDYPAVKSYAIHLALVLGLWAWAMNAQYQEELAATKAHAQRAEAEFVECLRGEWRRVTEQGVELGCMPVQINGSLKGEAR